MPIRSGPLTEADLTETDLAGRLSALRLPSAAPPVPATGRTGWLPDQPTSVEPVPAAPASIAPEHPAAADRPAPLAGLLRDAVEDRLPLWAARGITGRVGRRAIIGVLVLAVVAVMVGVTVAHRRPATPAYTGATWPGSITPSNAGSDLSAPSTTAAATADSIVVDVGGKVRRPGLVTLPPGSRVADAIAAAGGALRRRDVATMDLAARVGDGQLLLVGPAGAAATGSPASGDPAAGGGAAAPVNLSSADLTTLETLPGIGPVTAQKIIDWRTAHNGFTSIEQLQQVPGIGPAHFAEVKSLVTP